MSREWQPIETAPAGKAILVHYKNSHGNSRIIKARYISRFTEEALDVDWDNEGGTEYNEANDITYCVEGWVELIDNWDAYCSVYFDQPLTHWMPLPEPPMEGYNEP